MNETKKDIVELIKTFDSFLDDMFDRGAFDPNDESDREIDDFLEKMKEKYLNDEN